MSFSYSLLVCFIAILQVLLWVFLIFDVFQCFLPYSRSYSVCVSFSTFFSFLATIQDLECVFLILHLFHFFSPYSKSYSVCVSFNTFFCFLGTIQFLQFVFLIFKVFHCFLPTIFHVLQCDSHFTCFSVFLAVFLVLLCEFLFFLVFQFSRLIPGPTVCVCVSHFTRFSFS